MVVLVEETGRSVIYCVFCIRGIIYLAHSERICLQWTLMRRLFRGASSRRSCSWIVTGYLAFLDGSIGKDAVVAAMVNNKKDEEEEEEGEEEAVGVYVERTTIEIEDRMKWFSLAAWIAFVQGLSRRGSCASTLSTT